MSWDYCHPEVETLAPGCDEEWFALPEYQRAHLHLYAVASVGAPDEQVQGLWDAICRRWPHPCYLGASYLNCGWSWLYECQAYPDTGSEACWEVGADRYPTRYRAVVQRTWERWWPHRCTHRPQERWQCLE